MRAYTTPNGYKWDICGELLNSSPHLLIAGATGAGKSTLLNSIIFNLLESSPVRVGLVLIDLKKVELIDYKELPQTVAYADTVEQTTTVLQRLNKLINDRYKTMQQARQKRFDGIQVYVIIDEYADLIIKSRREVEPLISDIAILGRAAGVHLIIATQRPTREVIGGAISANLDSRVALRTATAQDSRNIINAKGAEELPPHGVALWRHGAELKPIPIPQTPAADIAERVRWWEKQA